MKRVLLMCCLLAAVATVGKAQSENWRDSVKTYINEARQGDESACFKLANCYYEGRGVERSYLMMAWMAGCVKNGMYRLMQSLPKDEPQRLMLEFFDCCDNEMLEKATVLGKRLAQTGRLNAKTAAAIEAMGKGDETLAAKRFEEAAAEGCEFGLFQQCVHAADSVEALLRIADRLPLAYAVAGDMLWSTDRERATECYLKADAWACLPPYITRRLNSILP